MWLDATYYMYVFRTNFVHFLRLLAECWQGMQSAWDNHAPACNCQMFADLKKITHRLSNKPFLIWLLTPPHLKYVATLPCHLSLMACFADINVSQGSVATHARCGGTFNIHLTANLPRNLPVKKNVNLVKVWQKYGHESVAQFFGPPCTVRNADMMTTVTMMMMSKLSSRLQCRERPAGQQA